MTVHNIEDAFFTVVRAFFIQISSEKFTN